jgi:hypothetical protein
MNVMACQRHFRGAKVDRAPALSERRGAGECAETEVVILCSMAWAEFNVLMLMIWADVVCLYRGVFATIQKDDGWWRYSSVDSRRGR